MRRRHGVQNRWTVYEHMKQSYMFCGEIPNRKELQALFPGITDEELQEGQNEFYLTLKRFVPALSKKKVVGR